LRKINWWSISQGLAKKGNLVIQGMLPTVHFYPFVYCASLFPF